MSEAIKSKEDQQRFYAMVESSTINIMTCDATGVINYLNPAAIATCLATIRITHQRQLKNVSSSKLSIPQKAT
jgi:hypothetical protein